MFRFLVSNLTAVVVLAHSVLGCCWHHEHAGDPQPENGAATEIENRDVAKCDCGHADADTGGIVAAALTEADHPIGEHANCDEGICAALRSTRKQSGAVRVSCARSASVDVWQASSATVCLWDSRGLQATPALPLRAATSVWLL